MRVLYHILCILINALSPPLVARVRDLFLLGVLPLFVQQTPLNKHWRKRSAQTSLCHPGHKVDVRICKANGLLNTRDWNMFPPISQTGEVDCVSPRDA